MTLAALRVRAGYSQAEASKHLGISKTTLIKWEADSRHLNFNQMDRIKALYQVEDGVIYLGAASELSALIKEAFARYVAHNSKKINVKGE